MLDPVFDFCTISYRKMRFTLRRFVMYRVSLEHICDATRNLSVYIESDENITNNYISPAQ